MTYPRLLDKVLHTEPANLVACWASCGESGAVLYDFARFGPFNGTIAGGVAPSTTQRGYDFDGVDGRIDIASARNANLLLNPGFETAGGGPPVFLNWAESAGTGAIANEGVIIHEGADAAKLTAGATRNTYISQQMVVVPGRRYRLRIWTRGDGTYGGQYHLWDVSNGAYIVSKRATGVVAAAYAPVVIDFVAPAGCTAVSLTLWCPSTNTGVAYFDACEVKRVHGFDGSEGSVLAVHQIPVAAYTDGIKRLVFQMQVDNSNLVQLRKAAANNTFEIEWQGNGDAVVVTQDPFSDTDVMRHGLGWSITDDMVTGYYNGASLGNSNMVFEFFGNVLDTAACIGASSNAGDNPYHGWIGLVALWSKKLTDTQFGYLGTP